LKYEGVAGKSRSSTTKLDFVPGDNENAVGKADKKVNEKAPKKGVKGKPSSSNKKSAAGKPSSSTTKLDVVRGDKESVVEKVEKVVQKEPKQDDKFDKIVKSYFPEALTNKELETRVAQVLADKGFTGANTLLATSLCCDELARRLEDDFVEVFGNNFNLGGLSGFPFAGNTGFGAMAAHIPDDGYCLIIYGPHVGVASDGTIGKVERNGIKLIDTCCGSAVAASNYVLGITDGGAPVTIKLRKYTDFQQNAVQELILPHGKRLADAKNRMLELPYALYDTQDKLMRAIVDKGAAGTKRGVALLGGIQINTGPTTPDYFHPLRFDFMNNRGEVVENMLPTISRSMISLENIVGDLNSLISDLEDKSGEQDAKEQMKRLSKSVAELVSTMMKDASK
jgi:hypothetical protein